MVGHVYIHIPFCIRKCVYCDFFSAHGREELIGPYIRTLCREIELRKAKLGRLKTIYIGGGTPSILSGHHITMILDKLRDIASLADETEITSEANPGTLNKTVVKNMIAAGINRLSIGVQSFQDRELKVLGRMHDSGGAVKAFRMAREGGLENISLDLIYGIPGQGIADWENTLERIVSLRPEHISAYELTPEKNTALYNELARGCLTLPDEEIVTEMYNIAMTNLEENGYIHYEISNFAQPGYECRHNLNYWNRGEYLGFGAGAHSFSGGRRVANVSDIDRYINEINEDGIPLAEDKQLTMVDELHELLFLGLRKIEGLNLRLVPSEIAGILKKAPGECALQGLIELSGDHLKLTKRGFLLCNQVIVRLMLDIERHRLS